MVDRSYHGYTRATPIATDTSCLSISAVTQGKPIALQNFFAHPTTDTNNRKQVELIRESYPEVGKREGEDGGLNKSKTCKRRSDKTQPSTRWIVYISIITHGSPTSGWHDHSRNPRHPIRQVGQCFVYAAMTLRHIVSTVYEGTTGGLNDAIENNHLGVLTTAPWYAHWH